LLKIKTFLPETGENPSEAVEVGLGRDSRAAALPVILKAAIEISTAQSQDGVGSPDGPEHSRAFETGSDHRFASGFDDARRIFPAIIE
jgi:hypothetical protein